MLQNSSMLSTPPPIRYLAFLFPVSQSLLSVPRSRLPTSSLLIFVSQPHRRSLSMFPAGNTPDLLHPLPFTPNLTATSSPISSSSRSYSCIPVSPFFCTAFMVLSQLLCSCPFSVFPESTCLTKSVTIAERLPPFSNAIIRATIEKGSPAKALLTFKSLLFFGTFRPDHRTIALVLKACTISPCFSSVAEVHVMIIKLGFQWQSSLYFSLFQVYLFHDLLDDSFKLFEEIVDHKTDPFFGNLLIIKFSRKNEIENSYKVFNKMLVRDKVSWNSMITSAIQNSRHKEALSLFKRMLVANVEPDCFSFSTILSACARVGALGYGERVHRMMVTKQVCYESNPIICSALIDMYSKCGRIDLAQKIFYVVKKVYTSISIWNSMITGLAIHGLGSDALKLFKEMIVVGIFPDGVTFVGILTACSHCGLVGEARFYFEYMQQKFRINPQLEHYGTMVDALARAGNLNEAHKMIVNMRIVPDAAIWRSLLGACRRHGRKDIAEMAMGQMRQFNNEDYILLSNIYSSTKYWEQSECVWRVMKEKGVRKGRGLSWVEMNGSIQQFKAADRSHHNSDDIYRVLSGLMKRAKSAGYVPFTEASTKDVSEEEKEENLSSHSEKLAVAYCVMKNITGGISNIRVSKNLQTCYDCHEWMKVMSKVLCLTIIVRDRIRFHRFENGCCSCGDYW